MRRVSFVASAFLCLTCRAEKHPTDKPTDPPKTAVARLDPDQLARALAIPPDSLASAAQQRYSDQAYDTAQALFRAELARATKTRDQKAEARARMWIGLAAWRLGDYQTARREGERALTMKRALGMDDELARSYNALGLVAWNEGRPRDALLLFDSATATARRHNDSAGVARAAANIPLVEVDLGDFQDAARDFPMAYAAAQAARDNKVAANDLANFAMLRVRLGEPSSAVRLLTQARERYAKIDYTPGEANALGQLATAWTELGDLQRAIGAADSALSIAQSKGLQQEMAAELEVIADLHTRGGDLQLALKNLASADSLDQKLGLAMEHGNNLRRTAAILEALGDSAGAATRARAALPLHRKTEAPAEVIYDRLQLARVSSRDAGAQIDTAMRDAVRERNPGIIHDVALESARYSLSVHDPRKALSVLSGFAAPSELTDWQTPDLRARAYEAMGRLTDADREASRSVAAIERERASLGLGPLRSGYLLDRVEPFARLVGIRLARGDTTGAFRVAASVPGRSLTEQLGAIERGAPAVVSYAGGERILLRVASIERDLSELANDPSTSERRASLQRQLQNAQAEYTDYSDRHAAEVSGVLRTASPTPEEIQARLTSDAALILFVAGPDRTDGFLVTRDRVRYRAITSSARAIAVRVRALHELLHRPAEKASAMRALANLHGELLGKFVDSGGLSGIHNLLIVPHGPLAAVPFAALWNAKTRRYAVEDYTITTLPSVIAATSSAPRSPRLSKLLAVAPQPEELPNSRREVEAIASLFPGTQTKIGQSATEPLIRAALLADRPVHIATHGINEPQGPLFSRLALAAQASANTDADGYLHVHEILTLATNSPLVFLSGCETGLGSSDNGLINGGENSIADAFLLAGAKVVVATLWKVDDEDAATIAENFYTRLRSGDNPVSALAKSQRSLLTRDPTFNWAAYTVAVAGNSVIASH